MSKLAMVVTLHVEPGRMDEYLPMLHSHRARCLQDEPGTLQIDVLRPTDDPAKVMIYVVYRDEEACNAHRDGPSRARHYQEFPEF